MTVDRYELLLLEARGFLFVAHTQSITDYSNQDLMGAALNGLVNKYDLKGQNTGRRCARRCHQALERLESCARICDRLGLVATNPGFDLQRACGTSLEACASIANKIALGQIESGIAGGVDSISDAPIVYPDGYRTHSARRVSRALCFRNEYCHGFACAHRISSQSSPA